jgi:hypothetical protein
MGEKIKVDGKEIDLDDFDDTRCWTKAKKDKGFYTHMTHESLQANEDSVKVSGDGFTDSSVPKTPKTDTFYNY